MEQQKKRAWYEEKFSYYFKKLTFSWESKYQEKEEKEEADVRIRYLSGTDEALQLLFDEKQYDLQFIMWMHEENQSELLDSDFSFSALKPNSTLISKIKEKATHSDLKKNQIKLERLVAEFKKESMLSKNTWLSHQGKEEKEKAVELLREVKKQTGAFCIFFFRMFFYLETNRLFKEFFILVTDWEDRLKKGELWKGEEVWKLLIDQTNDLIKKNETVVDLEGLRELSLEFKHYKTRKFLEKVMNENNEFLSQNYLPLAVDTAAAVNLKSDDPSAAQPLSSAGSSFIELNNFSSETSPAATTPDIAIAVGDSVSGEEEKEQTVQEELITTTTTPVGETTTAAVISSSLPKDNTQNNWWWGWILLFFLLIAVFVILFLLKKNKKNYLK